MLILSIPAVQTSLGKIATKNLNEKYKTNISVEKIGLQFNGDVELKNITILDYRENALITIEELNTSILGFNNLYNGKLVFGDIDIEKLNFIIRTYKDESETNLDIFVARFDSETPKNERSSFLMSSSDISINNSDFLLVDENKLTPKRLDFNNLNINATNFLINGPDVSARINTLKFRDSRGIEVTNLKTNFTYTLNQMKFEKLDITTPESHLNGNLTFKYSREDLQYFEDKVIVDANFKSSTIALEELNVLYNEFGKNQIVHLNTNLSGTLNNLYATNLLVRTSRNTVIDGDINFRNLFNVQEDNFVLDGSFKNLSSNYFDLTDLLPNVLGTSIPSALKNIGDFKIEGTSIITSKKIIADLDIVTDLGYVISNLEMDKINNIDNATYKGNIILDEFDLGRFLDNPQLGKTSLNVDVDGYGFKLENLDTKLKGAVYNVNFNNYNYSVPVVSGKLKNKVFNGNLKTEDINLKMDFNGLVDYSNPDQNIYDFTAAVTHADLKALKFIKRDSLSQFSGNITMNMKGKTIDDVVGDITFENTLYKNENDSYYFKDFAVTSKFNDEIREININSPEIVQGSLIGNFQFNNLLKLVENSVGSIYTNYDPHDLINDQFIDYDFKIYSKIAEVFIPDFKIGGNTTLKGHIETNAKAFKLKLKSPKIAYKENFAENINMSIDNSNTLFNTYVSIDSLYTKYYAVSEFDFINATKNDSLFIKTEFKGGKYNNDTFDLNLFYTINPENNSVIGFKKSKINFKDNLWYLNEAQNALNKVIVNKDLTQFDIKEFVMNHNQETMKLLGTINNKDFKDLKLDFNNVDISKVLPEIPDLSLAGNINGNLKFLQQEGNYIPQSNLTIDNFNVNDKSFGSFVANIKGNKSLTNYNIDISLKDDNTKAFTALGTIDVAKNNPVIDITTSFEKFSLSPLQPFLDEVFSDIRGEVSGAAKVSGSLNRPQINGNLNLDNGGLTIPYLNVDYNFKDNTTISLNEQSFNFNNAAITDSKYNTKAVLNGFLKHRNFNAWELNLQIDTDRFLVLNTEYSEDALYYGTGFIGVINGGQATITGPANQLTISAAVETKEGTFFKIPLSDSESFGDNSYIHFLTPEEKEAKEKGEVFKLNDISGLELNFELSITDDAEVEIIIDKDSGHSLKGKGQGDVLIEINTNDKFEMYGDFVAFEGVYNFVYGGLIQKQFILEPGGSIAWDGDPLKSRVDMKAIYKTQANPSVLLDNAINRSIPVNVEILLSGDLEQPTPEFNLSFPNVSSTIKSELDYRLEDKENRDLQALSLVTSGTFINEVKIDQQAIYGNLAERASAIINSLFDNADNKLQLGLDYQIGEVTPEFETEDRLGVTIQTKISDRILFNGKVGVPIGGVSESVVAGDAQIDFLLNEDGSLSAKVFNRENSIRNFGEEIGYTQGVGLSYNIEFDTFKEFVQIILKGKKKVAQEAAKKIEEEAKNDPDIPLPSYVNFKAKKTKEN